MEIRGGHGMQLGIVLFLILLPVISAAQNRVVVFTNGYTDCCAWRLGLLHRRPPYLPVQNLPK
jgi:hypothetical protein